MSATDTSQIELPRATSALRLALRRYWWTCAVAAGALVRLFCALFVSNSLDMRFYAVVATDGQMHKPLFADGVFSYPPLWGYVLQALGKVALWLHIAPFVRAYQLSPFTVPGLNSIDVVTPAMSLMIKLPIIAVDVALLFLIIAVVRRLGGSERAARYAALAWWLNPVVVFCSTINASWDAVVPLTMLAALALAFTGRWFAGGGLVAVGVMAKLTPLYAGFVAFAMALRPKEGTSALQRVLWLIAGGVAIGLAALAPVFWWHELAAMRAAVFTRTGTFVIGGPNMLAFTALQPFYGVRDAVLNVRGIVSLASTGLPLASIVIAAIAIVRIRAAQFTDYLYALIGIVSVVLIVTPYTQPTYAVWLLPFACILSACGLRYWTKYAIWLTAASFVFVFTIRSPFDLVTPLCYFAHACDPVTAGRQALMYRAWPFPFAENFQIGIDAVAGQVMSVIYILGLVHVVGYLRGRVMSSESQADETSRFGPFSLQPLAYASAVTVAALLLVMIPAPAAPLIDMQQGRTGVVIASRGFAGVVHTVRSHGVPAISDAYVYFDNHYAEGRGVNPTFVGGFASHLGDDVHARQLGVSIHPVDANALPAVLRGPARGVALTVMGGILPSTVRAKNLDLLQRWVARGGLVFWAAEPFDVLFSQPAQGDRPAAISAPDYSKWRSWYAGGSIFPPTVDPYSPPVAHGTERSLYWSLARLAFSKTTFACNTGPLMKMGGYPLGFVDAHVNSSISVIPYGRGRIVFFADGFDDEILAADAVSQILATDVWYRPDRLVAEDGSIAPGKMPMTISKPRAGTHVFAYANAMPDGSPFGNTVVK